MELVTTCSIAVIILLACHAVHRRQLRAIPPHLRGKCGPPPTLRSLDPFFHLDFSLKLFKDMTLAARSHAQKGRTYLVDSLFGKTVIHTIAPENLMTLYTQGKAWGVQPSRLPAMEHFCGQGFLTTDGAVWHQSRKMLKPSFARASISELSYLSRETSALVSALKSREGDTVDLQQLLFDRFLNNSMHFLLGIDAAIADDSDAPCGREQFRDAFQASLRGIGMRIMLGPLRLFVKFKDARQRAHAYIDFYVRKALEEEAEDRISLASHQESYSSSRSLRRSLVHGLASQTDDINYIRSQILQAMMASQETTAILIANTVFLLARHERYWQQLRKAVLERGEDLFTYDQLRDFKFVHDILKESLRLFPIFPTIGRTALCDTTLPVGGGPSHTQPIFVGKGTMVQTSFYALHRNPAVFGNNTEDFVPERWREIQPTQWEYAPFGGGQRACLGRDKVLAESAFVLCRLAQAFGRVERRDEEPWCGRQMMTARNKNGCKVAFYCG